jgi:hypothetical protein
MRDIMEDDRMTKRSTFPLLTVVLFLLLLAGFSWLAAYAQGAPSAPENYTFSGGVFDGPVGDETPIAGVIGNLWCNNHPAESVHPQHHRDGMAGMA